ncbi:MAG: thioredoxin family protein, partial [Marinirhabdus sp.]
MEIPVEKKVALVNKALENTMPYKNYRALVAAHANEGTSTGNEQTAALTNYTKLNNARMRRLDKTLKIPERAETYFKTATLHQNWLVITESWCGDAAQSMPAMAKIAGLNKGIHFRAALRHAHPKLMNAFLTNGAMSIPKLIITDSATNRLLGDWGPRPTVLTAMVLDHREK